MVIVAVPYHLRSPPDPYLRKGRPIVNPTASPVESLSELLNRATSSSCNWTESMRGFATRSKLLSGRSPKRGKAHVWRKATTTHPTLNCWPYPSGSTRSWLRITRSSCSATPNLRRASVSCLVEGSGRDGNGIGTTRRGGSVISDNPRVTFSSIVDTDIESSSVDGASCRVFTGTSSRTSPCTSYGTFGGIST